MKIYYAFILYRRPATDTNIRFPVQMLASREEDVENEIVNQFNLEFMFCKGWNLGMVFISKVHFDLLVANREQDKAEWFSMRK